MGMRKIRKLLVTFYNTVLAPLPSSAALQRIKIWVLRRAGIVIGNGVRIESRVVFVGGGDWALGDNVWLARNVCVQGDGKIRIGNNVEVNYGTLLSAYRGVDGHGELCIGENSHIAHFCSLKCSTQKIDPSCKTGSIVNGSESKPIRVGRGCWIGSGAIILPGVSVGNFNVVAAGAVVTKDTPDGVLVAGVPAVVKKKYVA